MHRGVGRRSISFQYPPEMGECCILVRNFDHKTGFIAGHRPHSIVKRAMNVLTDQVSAGTGFQDSLIAQCIWYIR
jgi:hypothetical protein